MTIREATKARWEEMKTKSRKERWDYFKYYYGTTAITILVTLILTVSLVKILLFPEVPGFYCLFMNSIETNATQSYLDEFAVSQGVDIKKHPVYTDFTVFVSEETSVEEFDALEKMGAMIAAGEVDSLAAHKDLFVSMGYNDYLMDLRTFLDEETLAKLEGRLIYIDQNIIETMIDQAFESLDFRIEFPEEDAPETMIDPVPVGVILDPDSEFSQTVYVIGDTPVLGISCTTQRPEMAKAFLLHALELN